MHKRKEDINLDKKESYNFDELKDIVEVLQSEGGCSWDRAQTFDSLKQYLVSETQEVLEAVDNGDMENLCEELGDVLFLLLLNSQIAAEKGYFTAENVIDGICRKMIRRHPHVFGNVQIHSEEEGRAMWDEIKRQEKECTELSE